MTPRWFVIRANSATMTGEQTFRGLRREKQFWERVSFTPGTKVWGMGWSVSCVERLRIEEESEIGDVASRSRQRKQNM